MQPFANSGNIKKPSEDLATIDPADELNKWIDGGNNQEEDKEEHPKKEEHDYLKLAKGNSI